MNIILSLSVLVVAAFILYGVLRIRKLSFVNLIMFVIAVILGLSIGALLSVPLGKLPNPYGDVLPLAVSILVTIASVSVFLSQVGLLMNAMPFLRRLTHERHAAPEQPAAEAQTLVDTSVIIDGRIADIAKAGFVPGKLLVTRFVLAELQNIADSDDAMRRGRGRRGLEILNEMRRTNGLEVDIISDDLPEIKEVDSKLVHLAKRLGARILTTDFNLNRVAQIEGVKVLNINELSNAIRPVVLPGEEMVVKIVQAGKERGQGVGYLADGTMIVVDNGDKLIGQEIATEVTRVFQTVAGKMIFATPKRVENTAASNTTPGARKHRNHGNGRRHNQSHRQHTSPAAIEDRIIKHNS